MLVGYARVSTEDQHLHLQIDALKAHGCEKIFSDQRSGKDTDRPGLKAALEFLREGDTLVVWKLDRLGRSLQDLIQIVNQLRERGIGFKSLQENMDTTSPGGKLIFHIFGALAEFEREIIRERTMAGLQAARARGRLGGRPRKLDKNKAKMVRELYNSGEYSVQQICQEFGISRQTLYNYLQREGARK
jgi:DNA invertase Pin-like site-specific DNA recombinase